MSDIPVFSNSADIAVIMPSSSVMLTMDQDGRNVAIDWAEVEKQANGTDQYLRCVAIALLAVRDKKWQPIDHQ